jgi:pantothenate kinase type III
MSQLLAVDIGNTTIAFGLFGDHKLLRQWRVQSDLVLDGLRIVFERNKGAV